MTTPTHSTLEWMILSLVLVPLTAIASIVTNAILIAAIRTRGKWNTTDTIFFALTISDCLHGVVSLVGAFTRMLIFVYRKIGDVLFPIMMTTFYYFLFSLPASISKTLTAMLSVERAIAVFKPAKFRVVWSKRRVIVMVCCIVFLITTSGIPKLFQLRGTVNHNDTSSSAFIVKLTELASGDRNSLFIYNLACHNLFGTVPIILVFVLNLATVVGLRRHNSKITSEGNNKHTVNRNKTIREQTIKSINKITKPGKVQQRTPLTEIPASISNQPYIQIGLRKVTDQLSVTGSPCTSGQQPVTVDQKVLEAEHTGTQIYRIRTSSMSCNDGDSTDPTLLCNDGVNTDPNLSSNSSGRDLVSTNVSSSNTTKTNTRNDTHVLRLHPPVCPPHKNG
ncbi:hypothetical protein KP79_PYT22350 [Mizuhopecten yessoensis]|uniref:G-protein coupled receptors family 1 profile domain-containing protein n=1 Tax=Mizuhopecten yessoensis TaxID=6573 RepID=A0A210PVH1_MIZYE|nr:hypothetical protein KP79_PYT22350 [Mizuhopecten yessoensis]